MKLPLIGSISKLCTPSRVYFWVSMLVIVVAMLQNLGGSDHRYAFGTMSCRVPSCVMVFALKIIYVLFWSWLLNLMCRDGHGGVAWFLVLLPFVLFFAVLALATFVQKKRGKKQSRDKSF